MGALARPSLIAAGVIAVVLGWAGLAKLAAPATTRRSFELLGLPAARLAAWGVPGVELAVAVTLILNPRWGGLAAVVLLVVFTAFVVNVWRAGRGEGCACFGSTSNRPIGVTSLVRNAALIVGAAVASFASQVGPPTGTEMATSAALVFAGAGAFSALSRVMEPGNGRRSRPPQVR